MPGPIYVESKPTADTTRFGFMPQLEQAVFKVRGGAVVAGDVMMLDLLKADAATTTADYFTTTSIFSNVIPPSAGAVAGTAPAWFVVCLEAADDDGSALCALNGPVDAMVIGAAGDMAIGTKLVVTTAKNLDIVTAAGEVVVAIGMGALAAPTSRTLGPVFFQGTSRFLGVAA